MAGEDLETRVANAPSGSEDFRTGKTNNSVGAAGQSSGRSGNRNAGGPSRRLVCLLDTGRDQSLGRDCHAWLFRRRRTYRALFSMARARVKSPLSLGEAAVRRPPCGLACAPALGGD